MPRNNSTANEYDNSWLLDVYTYSDHPNVKAVVDELFDELMAVPMYRRIPNRRKVRDHIKLVVLNLYEAYLFDPGLYVAYSMNENDYRSGRYNQLFIGYSYLKNIVDHLKHLEYLTWVNGFYDRRRGIGRITRIRATTKLMEKIVLCEVTPDIVYEHPERETLEEVIILRDANSTRRPIDYHESITTTQMRTNLKRINVALLNTFIGLFIPDTELDELNNRLAAHRDLRKRPINFNAKRLYRIFNRTDDFRLGGRFYAGWWQNIPKEYRKCIRISNGPPGNWDAYDEEVIELDYDAMHARMIYKRSIDYDWEERDPFEMEASDPGYRSLIKQAFYTMVNAETPLKAKRSIQFDINLGNLQDFGMDAGEVMEKVEEFHHAISDEFCQGAGLRLQRIDSDIAERVMLEMLDQGWTVLPMHDSFIAPVGAEDALRQSMHQAFLEKFEMPCPISRKPSMGILRTMYSEQMHTEIDTDHEYTLDQTNFEELAARVSPSQDRRDFSRYFTLWDIMQVRNQRIAA